MLTAICIFLIVCFILTFSIITEAKVRLDFYGEKSIGFYLFGLRVIKIDLDVTINQGNAKLTLKNKDKELTTIDLISTNRTAAKEALSAALPNPFYNLDIIEVNVTAEYGGDNAFYTAMISGVIRGVLAAALFYLITTQRVRTSNNVVPNFNQRTIKLNLSSIFCITIADIIYGIIFGKKGEKKNDN